MSTRVYPLTVTEDIKSVLAEVERLLRDASLPLCGTKVERVACEHAASEGLRVNNRRAILE